MKKLAYILVLFISLSGNAQTKQQERADTIEHVARDQWLKRWFTANRYEISTDKDSFNFNKPIYVNKVPIGGGLTQPFDSIYFNPNAVNLPANYKIWFDKTTQTFRIKRPGALVSEGINTVSNVPFKNITGDTIFKDAPISFDTLSLPFPAGSITCATDEQLARTFIGIAEDTILPDSVGIVLRFGFALNVTGTAGWTAGDEIYASCDSTLTNVLPPPPNYPIFVGIYYGNNILGLNCQPFIGNDTEVNISGALNGIKIQKPGIYDNVISNVLYAEINNIEDTTVNLAYMFSGKTELLNTTSGTGRYGRARVALSWGTDSLPLKQYVYIDNSSGEPELAVSTIGYPEGYPRVVCYGVYSQAKHEVSGFAYVRRVNDAVNGSDANGLLNKFAKWIRGQGSSIVNGVESIVYVGANIGEIDTLMVSTSSGVGRQLNTQTIEALSQPYHWWYSPNGGDSIITNLNEINVASDGTSLRSNNSRYRLNWFLVLNSGDYPNYLAFTVSNGIYATDQNTIDDFGSKSITNPPAWANDITVRVGAGAFRYTTTDNGTIINLIDLIEGTTGGYQDERNYPFASSALGGVTGGGGATYPVADNIISISNSTDASKILKFSAASISTGTERILTMADENVDLQDLTDSNHWHNNKSLLDNVTSAYTDSDSSKLASIEADAQVNTIDAGDNVSELVNDVGYIDDTTYIYQAIAAKQDTIPRNDDILTRDSLYTVLYTENYDTFGLALSLPDSGGVSSDSALYANNAGDADSLGGVAASEYLNKLGGGSYLAYYPFDGNADDESGLYDAIVNGATLDTGIADLPNTAYRFDGNDDNISPPTNLAVKEATCAMNFWMFIDSNFDKAPFMSPVIIKSTGTQPFYFTITDTAQSGIERGFTFGIDVSGSVSNLDTNVLSFNQKWVNVHIQRGASGFDIWLDGVKQNAISDNIEGIGSNESNIGGFNVNTYFEGKLDEISIFNRSLTEAEIDSLYAGSFEYITGLRIDDNTYIGGNLSVTGQVSAASIKNNQTTHYSASIDLTNSNIVNGDSITLVSGTKCVLTDMYIVWTYGSAAYTSGSTDTVFVKTLAGAEQVKIGVLSDDLFESTANSYSSTSISTNYSSGNVFWIDLASGKWSGGIGTTGKVYYEYVKLP